MEAVAAASPSLGASLPSSTVLKALLLMVMLAYLVQTLVRWRKSMCTAPLPPGPMPWPLVGNLPEMLFSGKPAFRWIHLVMEKTGTDIACVKLGGVHVIPVTCPKIAREVLKEQDANFASRPLTMASRTFSRGYTDAAMSPYGEQWRKMRRVLASEIVCLSRHKWLHGKRADEADNLTRYVYNLAGAGSGGAVDVRHVARHYCGNVVRRLVFGTRYFGEPQPDGGPGPLEVQHVDAVFACLGLLYAFCVSDYLPWLLGLDLDGHEKMVREAIEMMTRLPDVLIDERWRQWKSGEKQGLEDFLDVLITLEDAEAKPMLTIEEVKALSQDITFAAMDSPSNAVEWALAEMVNSPDMLKKAVEEIDGVVGRDRLVQESDIPRLNYLKACIREAFRLHPVVSFNAPHVALVDATVAGYHIPKGSHVILSRIGLGRNPAVWDDPLCFNPDRHIPADPTTMVDVTLSENDLRIISFSTGRRGCIATSLGTAMTVMLFARLLQGFSWRKPAGMAAVDLSEGRHDIFMAKPLVLHAEPRLPAHLYSATSM